MWMLQRLGFTFAMFFSAFWACFPGGFGLLHFRQAHPGLIGGLARLCWWLLLLAHPLALYGVWRGDGVVLWLGVIAAMHVLFFAIFVRDVSTNGRQR